MKTFATALVATLLLSACMPESSVAALEAEQAQQAQLKMQQIKKDLARTTALYEKGQKEALREADPDATK